MSADGFLLGLVAVVALVVVAVIFVRIWSDDAYENRLFTREDDR
jgi:hypothetical protein